MTANSVLSFGLAKLKETSETRIITIFVLLLLLAGCTTSEREVNADLCYSLGYNLEFARWLKGLRKADGDPVGDTWQRFNERGVDQNQKTNP